MNPMKIHPKTERTLVVIKPDGVQRTLIGEIVKRYERVGFKLVGLKMMGPTEEHIEKHYLLDPNWRKMSEKKPLRCMTRREWNHRHAIPLLSPTALLRV